MWRELLAALVIGMISDELLGWSDCLGRWLVRRNARYAPPTQSARLEEEWLAHLERIPGKLSRLVFALDCRRASFLIAHQYYSPHVSAWTAVRLRAFDLLLSLSVLAATMPTMLLAAFAIKIEDGWHAPVFDASPRLGQGGRPFNVLRFRSTRLDTDGTPTRVGRFLRICRIDQLPLILCVFRGHMAFVGPRPEHPTRAIALAAAIPLYAERYKVKPGIIGWSQLCYPYGSTTQDAAAKLSYDLYFAENMLSVLRHIAILVQTVTTVVWGHRVLSARSRRTWRERRCLAKTPEDRGRNSRVEAWMKKNRLRD